MNTARAAAGPPAFQRHVNDSIGGGPIITGGRRIERPAARAGQGSGATACCYQTPLRLTPFIFTIQVKTLRPWACDNVIQLHTLLKSNLYNILLYIFTYIMRILLSHSSALSDFARHRWLAFNPRRAAARRRTRRAVEGV